MALPTLRLLSLFAQPAVQVHTTRQACRCLSTTPAYRRHVGNRKEYAEPATARKDPATGTGDRQFKRQQRTALAPQYKTGRVRRVAEDTGLHDYSLSYSDSVSALRSDSRDGKYTAADNDYRAAEDDDRTAEDDALYRLPPKKPKQRSREVSSAPSHNVYEDDSNVLNEDDNEEDEEEEKEVAAGKLSVTEEADKERRLRRHNSDFSKSTLMRNASIELARTEDVNPGMLAVLTGNNKGITFNDLHLHPAVTENLSALGVKTPTDVQVKAIPHILDGKSIIVSAETGSGKTLAYLAPLISAAHREHADEGYVGELGRPAAIVLQPSLELVEQCYLVAMAMKGCNFRPMKLAKGVKVRTAKKRLLSSSVDIIITTPASLLNILSQLPDLLTMKDVKTVVVDECDTLVDKNFESLLTNVHNQLKGISQDNQQWIYTGATVPPEAIERIRNIRPDALEVVTNSVHKPLPNINYEFYKAAHQDRMERVVDLLKHTRSNPGQTIIFCNTVHCCDWATNVLSEQHFNVTKLHSGCSFRERTHRYKLFNTGEVQILVCTDIVSRGLDTMRVSHVINLDFPVGMAEFLHRSGRVGRVGTDLKGRCTSFVVKTRDQRTANIIKTCIRERKPLPNIELW